MPLAGFDTPEHRVIRFVRTGGLANGEHTHATDDSSLPAGMRRK